jgi:glycosyltransferase involved in cell wall biosynthesis
MMYNKNVSVILTTFNGATFIEKQIQSILKQNTPPDEIIICDDNSTDGTVSLLNTFINNKLIKVFVNGERLGVVENFKKAAKLARQGNWLVFADQDDIWAPQKLTRLMDEMQVMDDGYTAALIYSDLSIIDKNDVVISESFWAKQKIRPEKIKLATLLYGNIATGCTMIINYPMAEEFFEMGNANFLHDEWLALIAYSFGRARFLRDKLVFYRRHEGNVTFSEDYKVPGFKDSIKEDVDHLSGKKKFLPHEFDLAKAFLLKYRSRLSHEQINIIERFIKQENKNYIVQRIRRRITFI